MEVKKVKPLSNAINNAFIAQTATNPAENAFLSLLGPGSVSGPSSIRASNMPSDQDTQKFLKTIDDLTKKLQDIYKLNGSTTFQRKPYVNPEPYLKELFKALEKHTGIKYTQERRRAIIDFFKAGAKNKPTDVHADGEGDFIDVIKIYETGKFDPKTATPLQVIENLTKRIKYLFDHNLNADHYLQKLFTALEQYTGKKITLQRKDEVIKFFRAVAANNGADTNADGKNDFNDVLKIWKAGRFLPMGWSPEADIPLPY